MRKISGFIMLLLVALLVTLPVAASDFESDNGFVPIETKTTVGEEVAVWYDGEMLAAVAVGPYKPEAVSVGSVRTTIEYFCESFRGAELYIVGSQMPHSVGGEVARLAYF